MPKQLSNPGDRNYPGVVSVWELYTLDEIKKRLRWTDSSLRAARRSGLKLLVCGKRKYVSGREILRFLGESLDSLSPLGMNA